MASEGSNNTPAPTGDAKNGGQELENDPEIPDVSLLDFCAQLEDYTPTVRLLR